MPSGARPFDRGTERGRRLRVEIGGELRGARSNRGLRLGDVSDAVGTSVPTASRIERGVMEHVDVMLLARMCAVVGLDLTIRAYPGGDPIDCWGSSRRCCTRQWGGPPKF